MLKRLSLNKISKMTLFILLLFLFCIYPKQTKYNLNTKVVNGNNYHDIFLIDDNNYVSKTTIAVNSIESNKLAQDLVKSLIIGSENSSKIPNNFKAIIPKGTKIQKININDKYLTISFDDNILKTNNKDKMIECIVYTLTSIKNITNIKILVNDKENSFFDKEYTRSIGINKKYNLTSLEDINNITIYYVSSNNDNNYYIPVTKYINTKDDKIKIIIEELSSSSSYQSNLMSYLNYDTKLISYDLEDNELNLYFNDAIINKGDDKILEEVIYSISYSMKDSINVDNIHFYVNDKEFK